MKAILLTDHGAPELLSLGETSPPLCAHDQIRVAVKAVGVNRADILQRKGLYNPPPPIRADILGLEYAGEIIELGSSVAGWKLGARVMGITAGAAYAEEVVVHSREALPIPDGLSYIEAAAVPEAFLTAYDALFLQLELQMGDRLLIHAIGSGVGNAALQLAKATSTTVIGTSRSPAKLELARQAGADEVLLLQQTDSGDVPDFSTLLSQPVHFILDFVGASYLKQNMRALTPKGEMIVVGLLGGRKEELDLGLLLRNRLKIRGTVLRMRPLEEKIECAQQFRQHVLPLFTSQKIHPVIDQSFPMNQVAEAHLRMESNLNYGKIILYW